LFVVLLVLIIAVVGVLSLQGNKQSAALTGFLNNPLEKNKALSVWKLYDKDKSNELDFEEASAFLKDVLRLNGIYISKF